MEEQAKPISARRNALGTCNKGEHAGLLLGRYLGELNNPESKQALLEAAIKATQQPVYNFYRAAYERRQKLVGTQKRWEVKTFDNNRLIVGLGNTSVLETSLTLHHTYGTPIIPGSALKGLCAHHTRELFFDWLPEKEDWVEKKPELLNESQYFFIFGDTENVGHIIFHDAWIVPDSLPQSLKPDVMTPHHADYYSQADGCAPTDFDSPKPISFLSVSGTFEILLSATSANGENWIDIVWEILKDALETRGIGGKTSSGYGRMMESHET